MRRIVSAGGALAQGLAAVRAEFDVPSVFPEDVAQAADTSAARRFDDRRDDTAVPYFTLDPPGARDLDQAMHLSRTATGYEVKYAIADAAAFVDPGGAIDIEAHARGVTLYLPDGRVPLHPPVLSEGAASLLPGEVRPAVVWSITIDTTGNPVTTAVGRALVRSVQQDDYVAAQRELDGGSPREQLVLLREIGLLRQALAVERGAIDVRVPDQEIVEQGDRYRLEMREPTEVEEWNAQISLLTGMAAATLMLAGGIGLLRTMPDPATADIDALHRTARALGIAWPDGAPYQTVIATVNPRGPGGAAFLEATTTLLRGAGYEAFDGAAPLQRTHSGVAAPYAHVTAPLRRLADRYATEICLSICAGVEVPAWVRSALPGLPATMAAATHRANALERASVDLLESVLLHDQVGQVFDAVPVTRRGDRTLLQLGDPPVRAWVNRGDWQLGAPTRARLTAADPTTRTITFEPA